MVEMQMQPLDLSCPGKKLSQVSPLCLTVTEDTRRRLSGGSDEAYVTSTDPDRDSDSDQPQDLSRDQDTAQPARKRFLSKFFKDPKGKKTPSINNHKM